MLIEQIHEKEAFTTSEQKVLEFIEIHPHIVVNLSLEDLAKECHVSQATVIRLCQKLNTKGYSDFRVKLSGELTSFILEHEKINVDIPIAPNASYKDIAKTFYNLSSQTLEHTFRNLSYPAIAQAANLLAMSDIIHIYGRGESLILAEDFQYKLMRIGKHCHLEPLNGFTENLNRQTLNSKFHECALVISQYCNSTQVHYIIDELVYAKIPFILLTAAGNIWPYNKYAKVVLKIDCQEHRNKMGCFASRTAFLYILDCIYGLIFSKNYARNRQYLIERAENKATRDYYYTYFNENRP